MKKNSKMKLKSLFRWVILVLCGLVLGINVYLTNAKSLVGNQLPMPFGYGSAVVLSGSMEPEFSKGDLIVVKKTSDYKANDVVVFQDEYSLVVHRIIDINGNTVTTKGDANNSADPPIDKSDIKGRVLFCIPYVGKVASYLKSPIGTVCIIAAIIALIEIPRRNEKKKDDEDRQKILDEIERLKNDI
ncbi:MAG: signal peptidase I [Ruminococcaceae bacterium]|nr:signal peptidase I [Oscillospiraceae bacterium]